MNQFEMPYLFIFSNEELCRLWSAYRQIARVIRENQERTNIAILEDEVRSGAHFRAKVIVDECRRREELGRATFEFDEDNDTYCMCQ